MPQEKTAAQADLSQARPNDGLAEFFGRTGTFLPFPGFEFPLTGAAPMARHRMSGGCRLTDTSPSRQGGNLELFAAIFHGARVISDTFNSVSHPGLKRAWAVGADIGNPCGEGAPGRSRQAAEGLQGTPAQVASRATATDRPVRHDEPQS